MTIFKQIASELSVQEAQVIAAVTLLDDGNTVPFIARYRKEVTNGLDDTQLRTLEARLSYLRELEDRRQVILKSIDEQGKLSDALRKQLIEAQSKTVLEDLYLPYKPKRRTKGQIAIEAGILPLAEALWQNPQLSPEEAAQEYLAPEAGFADSKAVLEGARAILMEQFAEDAQLLGKIRQHLQQHAHLQAQVIAGKEHEGAKFQDYFEYDEKLNAVPPHRALALFRGRNEGILQLSMQADPAQESPAQGSYCEKIIMDHYQVSFNGQPADAWRKQVVTFAWKIKIQLHMETEFLAELREKAELQSIEVFASNLKDLLMAAPAGPRCTMGIDPGLRTGCKVAVVDNTGKLIETATIYPTAPHNQVEAAARVLLALIKKHHINLIAIGNGTASRETDAFVAQMLKQAQLKIQTVIVSEAGASVYSASQLAADEFPQLDVSLRGAVSIARRLQDPLAELVKIDPKSIGVGQYQHDVNQNLLAKKLDAVVEDCVNSVGVDVNSASAALLCRVAGLSHTIAANIVAFRDANGRFTNRKTLLKVPRLGPKAFEQCGGFLRVMDGSDPLDASAVHPEAYPLVQKIAHKAGKPLPSIIGNHDFLRTLKAQDFADETFGIPTITDILQELAKPGRDPRPEFTTVNYADGIHEIKDLKTGMILEGVITNVTHFGAFVDIGVHQDGLVHISALSDKFISDPRELVKTGMVVKVKVMEVDAPRKRIGLSMRLSDDPAQAKEPNKAARTASNQEKNKGKSFTQPNAAPAFNNAFAQAFANAKQK
ncbi:MAG: Tex family protein [Vibrionaceae bacterium]